MMDRYRIVAVFVLFFIASDISNASLLSMFQRFVAVASTGSSGTNQVSPSPSPDPLQMGTNTTLNETSLKSPNVTDNSTKVDSGSKGSISNVTVDPPPQNENDKENIQGTIDKNENKLDSQPEVGLSCTGMPRRCKDQKSLVACILNYDSEHKKLIVLVQNEGESNLEVDVSAPNPSENDFLKIPKHQTKKINLTAGTNNEVIFRAGYGDCILHTELPVSQGNFFLHLASYEKLATPINGAYFLIITVLIFGGLWAICLIRKRKRQDGIPYQELEMSLPESALTNNGAESWDEGWDDDWDEENAVKSPTSRHTGSISANGLTSRSPKKDGWENDWDG